MPGACGAGFVVVRRADAHCGFVTQCYIGGGVVDAVWWVKNKEYDAYHRVISSWERENLLLNV